MRNIDGIYEKVSFQNDSSILLYKNRIAEHYSTHWHTAVEIIMPLKNIYTVVIGKTTYILKEGDILIIPPGELHELIAPQTGLRYIMLFEFSLLHNLRGMSNILAVLDQARLITGNTAPEIYNEINNLFKEAVSEYDSEDTMKEAAIFVLIIQIFIMLGRYDRNTDILFPDVKQNKQREYIEKLNYIIGYINENYTETITLDQIADVAGFSKFHFSRLFKQFTDLSFYDYLSQRRVKEAEKLLLEPNLAITEVAMRSGFSSISTFNRVFKSIKECTPTEFKNLYRSRNYTTD